MAKLAFRFSSMNAGKSTLLLQVRHTYEAEGRVALMYTAGIDDRFGVGKITSRLGISSEAQVFKSDTDMFEVVRRYREPLSQDLVGAVLIDEAQFLSGVQVQQLHRAVHAFNVPVMCFGLRSDFKGNPFEGAAMLLTLAEDIQEVKTVCRCARKATMNMRVDADGQKVKDGPQVEIGDTRYRQVCAGCFYKD